MAQYDNNMSGALFKNDKKNDRQPDYRGSCEIEGTEYWISAWIKKSKAGKTFMSLAFQEKDSPASSPSSSASNDFDDDIPF